MLQTATNTDRYAKCIAASKRVRWDIDADVIRARTFDAAEKFLPSSLTFVDRMDFLTAAEKCLMSQIQGRTYANMFGMVERYINGALVGITKDHVFGDQIACEALVRFSDEELKHQELFRRIERLCAEAMPAGYRFVPDPNEVAAAVLSKSTWAVLGLTCMIELVTQVHYRESIDREPNVSPLYKDVFLHHWREEAQHAILDEIEWDRVHAQMSAAEVDSAVDDLIALVGAVDGILQVQAAADVEYFRKVSGAALYEENVDRLLKCVLAAYRWQYILSGVQLPRAQEILGAKITPAQFERIGAALAPLSASA